MRLNRLFLCLCFTLCKLDLRNIRLFGKKSYLKRTFFGFHFWVKVWWFLNKKLGYKTIFDFKANIVLNCSCKKYLFEQTNQGLHLDNLVFEFLIQRGFRCIWDIIEYFWYKIVLGQKWCLKLLESQWPERSPIVGIWEIGENWDMSQLIGRKISCKVA